MKIGIMTFWESINNYGQILQLFAMQSYLTKIGHSPFLIPYHRVPPPVKMSLFTRLFRLNPISSYRRKRYERIKVLSEVQDLKRQFSQFKKQFINFGQEEYYSLSDLIARPPIADVYVTGSDQVWNNSFQVSAEAFLLGFGDSRIKRVAFAASFGKRKLDTTTEKLFKKYIHKFSAVGIREKSGLEICNTLGYRNAKWVLDPTFLFTKSEWEELLGINFVRNVSSPKTVFIYTLGNSEIVEKELFINYAKSLEGFVTLHATANNDSSGSLFPTIPEWVSYIGSSELVITTSFHGMVFCLINNTKFIILPNTGAAEGMNERIDSLLSLLGLEHHKMTRFDKEHADSILRNEVDWAEINRKISDFRQESMKFLAEALER